MELQLISKQPFIFRVKNKDYQYVKPYYLMPCNEFRLIKGVVKGSCLAWNIEGDTLTYGRIKKLRND